MTRAEARLAILSRTKPFSLSDLCDAFPDDKNLIIQALNELYNEGLIVYRQIAQGQFAFVADNNQLQKTR